jgi:murein L,D-transpeptidase YcbB/YkuD
MKNRWILLSMLLGAFLLNGCIGPDKEGWRYKQKNEFLKLLAEDRYLSICDSRELYEQIRQNRNSILMSRMLVEYAKNLTHGCIDLDAFDEAQALRKARGIESVYERYTQEVDEAKIMMQLRAGLSMEQILLPYVPKNEQFSKLLKVYHSSEYNLTKEQREKVRLNIERVKLMNRHLGEDYALVNIPEFMVRMKHHSVTNLKFRVVVGKSKLQTPIFSARLEYVTLNPQWSVPDSIARKEIIPHLLKDPEYLKKKRMVVRTNYNLTSKELNVTEEELSEYVGGKGEVPFKFIEVPSRWNGLGRVKFIFPNQYSVYMHDTQSKGLFRRKVRTYSHGCVRLQKPQEMLKYIATHYTDEAYETVQKWYKSLKTHHLKLTKPLMVHTAYLTSYVDEEGRLLMLNDIYGYDKIQKLNF